MPADRVEQNRLLIRQNIANANLEVVNRTLRAVRLHAGDELGIERALRELRHFHDSIREVHLKLALVSEGSNPLTLSSTFTAFQLVVRATLGRL